MFRSSHQIIWGSFSPTKTILRISVLFNTESVAQYVWTPEIISSQIQVSGVVLESCFAMFQKKSALLEVQS